MQFRDLVREWLQQDIIGFHCQQAVEKCLKAFLVLHDIEPPRSHDLLFLKTICQSVEGLPDVDDTIPKQP
jgi:HEPN domain-containing protein